jgi:hypothetical protein
MVMHSAFFDKALKNQPYLKVMALYRVACGMQAQAFDEGFEQG